MLLKLVKISEVQRIPLVILLEEIRENTDLI